VTDDEAPIVEPAPEVAEVEPALEPAAEPVAGAEPAVEPVAAAEPERQAEVEVEAPAEPAPEPTAEEPPAPDYQPAEPPVEPAAPLSPGAMPDATISSGSIRDIVVRVGAELGRVTLPLAKAVGLMPGAVIELDRAAEEPIDLYVNGRRFATGQLLLVDQTDWAIRIEHVLEVDADASDFVLANDLI
jgi:flagellar motor switch/type III secretory pathway protein FliN